MKFFNLKLTFIALTALLFFGFYSCKKDEVKKEPQVTVDAASNLKAFPGLHRAKLSWEVKDEGIKKAVAYCDNGDSVVVPYEGAQTMTALFTGLEGGNYSFWVNAYDAEGHASARAEVVIRVYGERFIQSLSSRQVKGAIFEDGAVQIAWDNSEEKGFGTQVKYVDIQGDTQTVFVKKEQDTTVLQAYKPGTYFKLRTLYKPVPEAIDTFYAAFTSSKSFSTFSNPLFTNKGADPWVVYKDGMYYFTYTQGGGITLYATKKMSELGSAEPVEVWRPQSGTSYSRDLWAPELHFIDGKWYVYFAADDGHDVNHRMYVIENASPDPLQGTWTFKGELEEPADEWAIDGTPLEYNGNLYMIWSGKTNGAFPQNIYIAKMSNPYTLSGSRIKISTPEYSWEKNGAPINEGPQILKNKDGEVYLVYSASGFWTDDYSLGLLSLKPGGDPLNPADWTKNAEPVFTKNANAGAFGPGHCSFFKSRDGSEDWILYHARSFPDGGRINHRNPRIQKFTWNANGTPDFGEPVKINTPLTAPSGEF